MKRLYPGENGIKKLLRKYGDDLLYVRYQYDYEKNMRYTTVELIVDKAPLQKRISEKAAEQQPKVTGSLIPCLQGIHPT